jgi:signal peptidase I
MLSSWHLSDNPWPLVIALHVYALHVLGVAWLMIDAKRRDCRSVVWGAFTLFFGLLVLLPWLVVRRRYPVVRPITRSGGARFVALAIALVVSADVGWTAFRELAFQVARIEGSAMSPTLRDQDRLIINKLAYQFGAPQVGDVVMMQYPKDPTRSFVKRIIAASGDTVRSENGQVYRNDTPLFEPFIAEENASRDDWGPQVVPEGHYFVLGDKRNNSSDSRHWGFVPRDHILGRAGVVWYRRR